MNAIAHPIQSPNTNEIHIASLIIRARLESMATTQESLTDLGFSIHAVAGSKIIATLECEHPRDMMKMTDAARCLAGVAAADVIYHHCESAQSLDEPMFEGVGT